jgi:RNA polymerase sigma-70 factor, ECF subfamily
LAFVFRDRIEVERASLSVSSLPSATREPPSGPEAAGRVDAPAPLPASLEALVTAHFSTVWRALRHLGVAEADIDDAAQQVFCTALDKLESIRPPTERSWLLAVAVRIASRFRRTRTRRREVSEDLLAESHDTRPGPDDLTDQRIALSILDGVLDQMPDELREVLVFYEIEELTVPEIADVLGIPRGTAASRLRRARADFERRVKSAVRPRKRP